MCAPVRATTLFQLLQVCMIPTLSFVSYDKTFVAPGHYPK